jgi:hypothetical protein
MPARLDACSCGQTDITRYDHITGAALCFACDVALTDFCRWLDDDARLAADLGAMTYVYGSDAERAHSRRA